MGSGIYKDGWTTVHGSDLYVADGIVIRARKKDQNGSYMPAAVYEGSDEHGWEDVDGRRTISTVRCGLKHGTYKVM